MRSAYRVPIRQSRQHLGMPRRRNAPVPSDRPMRPSCPRFTRPRLVAHHGVVAQHLRDRRSLWRQRQFLNRPRLNLPTMWDDGGKLPKLGPVRTARHAASPPDRRETESDAAASSIRRCESWLLSVVSSRSARRPARSPERRRASALHAPAVGQHFARWRGHFCKRHRPNREPLAPMAREPEVDMDESRARVKGKVAS